MKTLNIDILTLVLLPFVFKLIDFLSGLISEKFKLKTKKIETGDANIKACQEQHKGDVEQIRNEFNNRLDDIIVKMDAMKETQQKTQLQITKLRAGVEKNNNVIERTFKLEETTNKLVTDVAVISTKIERFEN